MKLKHLSFGLSVVCAAVLVAIAAILFSANVRNSEVAVFVPQGSTHEQLLDSLRKYEVLKSEFRFKAASKLLLYKTVRPGRYLFESGENSFSIVRKLRKGQHYPVKFTFNNVRTKEQLMEKLSKYYFLFEWQDLYKLLNDKEFLAEYNLTPETAIAIFIPDSYEFYYDITAEDFFHKMYGYYEDFWDGKRTEQAEAIGFTPMEVNILASIVEEENFREPEKAIIAGLYVNRLHKNMLLQSDPTVKYALGNFKLKRVLNEHLQVNSPYNTYRHLGLPPGPIRIPAKSTVDSVLHYRHHNYLYMCAKEDLSGSHNFTSDYNVHLQNARRYQAAITAKGL